ncbi:hypothetical protein N836_16400 [Leptolyngbya sp. Heron Island J]|nr:hypothetical protein N836_16400 [Leptolyngbya sp. Heron Island J]
MALITPTVCDCAYSKIVLTDLFDYNLQQHFKRQI